VRLAWRELRRTPGRFGVATAVLVVLAVLLIFLGGLLDGLIASSTGAFRAQRAELIVFSTQADESLVRSRIDAALAQRVASVPGVDRVGSLGSIQLAGRPSDDPTSREVVGVVVFGYDLAPRGLPVEPPNDGEVIADDSLQADGYRVGDTILVGSQRSPLRITAFTNDTQYAGQASLWGSLSTWRMVTAANRPDRAVAADTVAALVLRVDADRASRIAVDIDSATGRTRTMTFPAAIEALPGVAQQRTTFNQIIGVTAIVALLVVALFFWLITVERLPLYGTLKAIGASSRTLFGGVLVQAGTVTLVASVIGSLLAVGLDAAIPPGSVPFQLTVSRVLLSVALMLLAAAIGSVFSLRRVLRVDPASAIGAGA